jgi:hypothetical protein
MLVSGPAARFARLAGSAIDRLRAGHIVVAFVPDTGEQQDLGRSAGLLICAIRAGTRLQGDDDSHDSLVWPLSRPEGRNCCALCELVTEAWLTAG